MLPYRHSTYKIVNYVARGGERGLIPLNSTRQDNVIISTL